MAATRWDNKFFASTRGQIITLLRRATRTVEELAQALGLTDNAVRAHLAGLERDGLVQQSGIRRGAGKPAFTYDLSPEAERLFPKPYSAVLRALLEVLAERMPPEQLEDLLESAASHLAKDHRTPDGDVRERLEAAVGLLNELGGLAELEEEEDSHFVIRGFSCPLAAIVPNHPQICHLAEALLSEFTGLPLQECCERGDSLHCTFRLAQQTS